MASAYSFKLLCHASKALIAISWASLATFKALPKAGTCSTSCPKSIVSFPSFLIAVTAFCVSLAILSDKSAGNSRAFRAPEIEVLSCAPIFSSLAFGSFLIVLLIEDNIVSSIVLDTFNIEFMVLA